MIKFLSRLFTGIISLLPDSPFQSALSGELYRLEFLPYLNWFVPFDSCLKITQVWLVAVALYYTYDIVMDIIKKFFIEKI